jgi:hypothetical protein
LRPEVDLKGINASLGTGLGGPRSSALRNYMGALRMITQKIENQWQQLHLIKV